MIKILLLLMLLTACQTHTPPIEITEEQLDILCEKDTKIEASKNSISLSPYPCVVIKTYTAMEATEGRGFFMGVVPRFFLRTRLIARGVFSTVFGLLGLG